MIRALNTGVGGLKQFQVALDVVGNNLANINTVGFKSARVDFADTLAQTMRAPTPDTATSSGASGIQVGNGASVATVRNSFTQGAVNQTGVRTDLAITGEGFFMVKDPTSGEIFATRAGDFREDSLGYLVTNSGLRVQGVADSVNDPTDVGDIRVDRGTYGAEKTIGSIDLTTNQVTSTAHGFTTGNQVNFATTGTLPAATPGISNALTYFVRKVDDNTVTLHLTAAGSAAGTDPIDFTSAGAGTHKFTPGASVAQWSVGADGKVNMLLTDGTQYTRGQILLQKFSNPNALLRQGSNLYSQLEAAGSLTTASYVSPNGILASAGTAQSQGLGRIEAGTLELSNVDMTREFATLITTQRAFQANARVITTSDEVLMEMMQLKR